MSHGPTTIESKGACIYCGRSDITLTDEHIVPLSLGGQHVIREASCLACADITKRFEQDVARGLWGDARISYDAPSRRKALRKTHIVLADPHDPSRGKLTVPYHEYPAPMVFYLMPQAGLLQGCPETLDLSTMWQLTTITDDKKLKAFEEKYPRRLVARFRHVPQSFGRLIAKIGYGQALCCLELGDFRPICLPYVLGQRQNVSFVVGGHFEVSEPIAGLGYAIGTAGFASDDRMMIISEVKLIANNHTPTYHVVVGDVIGREKVESVVAKLPGAQLELLADEFGLHQKPSNSRAWIPQAWPLPFWDMSRPLSECQN